MTRHEMRVSCKAALFTPDRAKVLLAEYGVNHYGLPGGHMEPEDIGPDEAMARELREELGIENVELKRRDFWMHDNGKLILGYIGILSESTPLKIQDDEITGAVWAPVDEIESGEIIVNSYGEFILKFQ